MVAVAPWARLAGSLVIGSALAGCGLDAELFGAAMDRGHVVLPQPNDTLLIGRATPAAGGSLTFTTAGGSALPERDAAIDAEGLFVARFGGAEAHTGLFLWASRGDRRVAGVLPELPRQPTVFHEEREVPIWDAHGSLGDINAVTTALAFVAARASQGAGVGLDALPPATVRAGLDEIVASLDDTTGPIYAFAQLVASIDALARDTSTGEPVFDADGLRGGASLLSLQWVLQSGADLDGDGLADAATTTFDALLAQASSSVEFGVCYAADRIAVVWHLDLRPGAKDTNCSEVDAFKWASEASDKGVFLAGGVHEDTPVCGQGVSVGCLDGAVVDEINAQLGGWVPNTTAMFDDGTHGDAVAGDGVWTLALTLPYLEPASPGGAGVRLAYKYTYGIPGQGWTDSEEWPGNQRLLELVDLNGDQIVTRWDIFGDEAANKDKVNALKPTLGGCGFIQWEAERDPGCAGDSRENRRDVDGDCVPDVFDDPRPVVPITEECL